MTEWTQGNQRVLRTQSAKVILVTSALDSEGKTTFASNLALSFASLGVKTLLIDGKKFNVVIDFSGMLYLDALTYVGAHLIQNLFASVLKPKTNI